MDITMAEIDITSQIVNNLYLEDGTKIIAPQVPELETKELKDADTNTNTGK